MSLLEGDALIAMCVVFLHLQFASVGVWGMTVCRFSASIGLMCVCLLDVVGGMCSMKVSEVDLGSLGSWMCVSSQFRVLEDRERRRRVDIGETSDYIHIPTVCLP